MPSRAQSVTLTYVAWDTSANAGKTGDVANHTLRWVRDGTSAAPQNSPAEVDATNAPGVYKLTLTTAECTCDCGTLSGKSSTANVVIIPLTLAFEVLPAALHNGMVAASVEGVAGQTAPADVLLAAMADYADGGFTFVQTADGAIRPESFLDGGVTVVDASDSGLVAIANGLQTAPTGDAADGSAMDYAAKGLKVSQANSRQ